MPGSATFRDGFIRERILGLNGATFLSAGDIRLRVGGRKAVPARLSHERVALCPTKPVLPAARFLDASNFPADRDSIVSSGAPVSSDLSGSYLPVFALGDDPSPERKLLISRDAMPYHFATGEAHSVNVISGSQGGRLVSKRNNAVLEWHEKKRVRRPIGYIDSAGRLARDYMLVIRAPRTISGGEILIIAGLHGPATQAFELLFDANAFPDQEMRWLAEQIGDEPYFQAVFEVDDIQHRAPMSRASQLRCSRLLPPQPIYLTPDFFRSPIR